MTCSFYPFLSISSIHICSVILTIISIFEMSYRLLTHLQSIFNTSPKFWLYLTGSLFTHIWHILGALPVYHKLPAYWLSTLNTFRFHHPVLYGRLNILKQYSTLTLHLHMCSSILHKVLTKSLDSNQHPLIVGEIRSPWRTLECH